MKVSCPIVHGKGQQQADSVLSPTLYFIESIFQTVTVSVSLPTPTMYQNVFFIITVMIYSVAVYVTLDASKR